MGLLNNFNTLIARFRQRSPALAQLLPTTVSQVLNGNPIELKTLPTSEGSQT